MYSPFAVIQRAVPTYEFGNIFDVGANDGTVSVELAKASPECRVFAFEPVAETYEAAAVRCAGSPNVSLFCCAVGAVPGKAKMITAGPSVMNRISDRGDREVPVTTIDEFCRLQAVKEISYLKIDTEGNDLNVLRGAIQMLAHIDFVEVEASMNEYNEYHVGYWDFRDFLRLHRFGLLHIFEQVLEWGGGGHPIMRRANLIFVSPRIYGSLDDVFNG